MRVLITGSRDATTDEVIRLALKQIDAESPGPHTLVHGDARGADRLAAKAATELGWTVEAHRAEWEAPCTAACDHQGRRTRQGPRGATTYCPAAGGRRNGRMVALGADLCVAFLLRGAKNIGTRDCIRRAGRAGIPIRRFITV